MFWTIQVWRRHPFASQYLACGVLSHSHSRSNGLLACSLPISGYPRGWARVSEGRCAGGQRSGCAICRPRPMPLGRSSRLHRVPRAKATAWSLDFRRWMRSRKSQLGASKIVFATYQRAICYSGAAKRLLSSATDAKLREHDDMACWSQDACRKLQCFC